ncbi:MAG: hypothetical protein FJZ90_13590, partial [Chloroflexi bacterium]|nr:hypothetical protein [Chloroflexota bacterium]
PCQILDDKAVITREVTVVYRAQRVPSVGYTTYSLRPVQEATAWPATCQVTDEGQLMPLRLETDAFSFVLHRQNGHVDLYDKALGRWVLQGAAFVGEETDLEKRTHAFDHIRTGREFPLAVDSAELLENGPVQARVVVRGLLGTIKVEQEWTLYQGVRRVDLTVTTEGPGRIPAALQQTFPTGIAGGRVCFGVPYGANTFENVMPQLEPKVHNRDESNHDAWVNLREVQDWVDISNGSYGVCIATGHRMTEIVAPTILAKLAFGLVPPERRTYRFRIHPHSGDWRAAKAYRWGCQLASPLAVLSVNDPFTEKRLTKEQSFCSLSADHVVLTVLKRSEDGQQLVWRGYEAEGKDTTMALRFFRPLGLGHLAKTNLLEEQATAVDAEDIPVRPYEIVTLTERNNA